MKKMEKLNLLEELMSYRVFERSHKLDPKGSPLGLPILVTKLKGGD